MKQASGSKAEGQEAAAWQPWPPAAEAEAAEMAQLLGEIEF